LSKLAITVNSECSAALDAARTLMSAFFALLQLVTVSAASPTKEPKPSGELRSPEQAEAT
jgi:hypothetical protein